MSYYFSIRINAVSFEEAVALVTEELKKEGFGVLTQVDVRKTLKEKLGVDFRRYLILGACNPHFAHEALQAEPKLGVFLPCNVVVEEAGNGQIEVSMIDPIAMVSPVQNDELHKIATGIRGRVQRIVEGTARNSS